MPGRLDSVAAAVAAELTPLLAEAARRAGHRGPLHLTVPHVSDPAEGQALRRLAEAAGAGLDHGGGAVTLGGCLTSPRAAAGSADLLAGLDLAWVEVGALQALVFGLPPEQLLTADPLDDYLRRGLLGVDPRRAVDPVVAGLLGSVAQAAALHPHAAVGVRLAGPVREQVVQSLHRLGFRRFAVESLELRPLLLALGQAALS